MSQVISVSIPDQIMKEIDACIPKNKRSQVVTKAFSKYLETVKRKRIEKDMIEMYDNLSASDKHEIEELCEESFIDENLIDEL